MMRTVIASERHYFRSQEQIAIKSRVSHPDTSCSVFAAHEHLGLLLPDGDLFAMGSIQALHPHSSM
jgi:hypothetical protein